MKFTIKQFNERFPTSDACLEELKQLRYADFSCPKCERKNMLSKIAGRPQYACACGFQVAPLAGTIFHKSSTDLRTWFMTMYMMTQTRNGVSAKTIERTTGVTYKTAWRMMKQIRSLMDEGGDLLTGTVEADETYFKANTKRDDRLPRGKRTSDAEVIFGMVEQGGRARVKHVPNVGRGMLDNITENVSKTAIIYTDGFQTYKTLNRMGYQHYSVDHSAGRHVANGIHTQNIDSFWSILKRGFKGTYIHCGINYFQSYANEYAWRYSYRRSKVPMFELLLGRVADLRP